VRPFGGDARHDEAPVGPDINLVRGRPHRQQGTGQLRRLKAGLIDRKSVAGLVAQRRERHRASFIETDMTMQ
jgi:hypothetical protein